MEHRWGERSKLNIPVRVDCGSRGVVLGVMRDASASGAFLCTAAQLHLLAKVRLELRTGCTGIEAQVVRRASDGFGLEWMELAPPAIVALLSAPRVTATVQSVPAIPTVSVPAVAATVPPPTGATHVEEGLLG